MNITVYKFSNFNLLDILQFYKLVLGRQLEKSGSLNLLHIIRLLAFSACIYVFRAIQSFVNVEA